MDFTDHNASMGCRFAVPSLSQVVEQTLPSSPSECCSKRCTHTASSPVWKLTAAEVLKQLCMHTTCGAQVTACEEQTRLDVERAGGSITRVYYEEEGLRALFHVGAWLRRVAVVTVFVSVQLSSHQTGAVQGCCCLFALNLHMWASARGQSSPTLPHIPVRVCLSLSVVVLVAVTTQLHCC